MAPATNSGAFGYVEYVMELIHNNKTLNQLIFLDFSKKNRMGAIAC
jgi:hypothetical protein